MHRFICAGLLLQGALGTPIAPQGLKATVTLTIPKETDKPSVYDWSEGWKPSFHIHQSCNSTLRAQLQQGLDEAVLLAQHARDHLLRWGNRSEFTQKYFGNGSTATPIGWYDRIVAADKTGMLFRCDDPDRNCATQKSRPYFVQTADMLLVANPAADWAGHWRGDNATTETVICPLSFQIRRPLSAVCNLGYTVAESKLNTYWATDLLHRLFHVPTISEGIVDHFADDYPGVLELAKSKPDKSGVDSDTLQYFAIDVWAYDMAAPGVGCTGKAQTSGAPSKPASTPTATSTGIPSATSSAPTSHMSGGTVELPEGNKADPGS
ncbi:major allergen Asp f 2-like protein [Purpureocillium lavendulum]|uniref:Major allergen Asp f 2-like protein n=1 Tax=Purpureocillium lavendulum TaxID=1247861 RepID=A0AB34FXR9_9HYPO|nr:major allergen Asp f 2-like protein [Purpureocillium lavendulum]